MRGLARLGRNKWLFAVEDVIFRLKSALIADYVVLGGGNAKLITELPPNTRRGSNEHALLGGLRLWDPQLQSVESRDGAPPPKAGVTSRERSSSV